MARYALINPSNGINRLSADVDPSVQTRAGWRWKACPVVASPSFNPATEIVTGPTYTVNEIDVTEAWTKRNLTAQELSDLKDSKISAIDELQFLVSFDMENRVRSLEGKPVVSAAQYRTALKARL